MNSIKKSKGQLEVELQEVMGNDRTIANSAWTSSIEHSLKKNRSEEDVNKIINMLADLKHSVPFESIVFRFWIKMPIQTDRQFMTHRLQSASGMSGRYRTMPNEFLTIPNDVENIIKQGISELYNNDSIAYNYLQKYNILCSENNSWYNNLLKELKNSEKLNFISNKEYKRVREFFRGVLPQNNMTERVTTINLRSLSNFFKLRLSEDAQPEIRQIAETMLECVKESNIIPIALKALEKNQWTI